MKPSILFLTTSSNWPLTDGKRQRTWFLLEALSKKFSVDVLLIGYQKDKDEFNTTTSSINKLYFVNTSGLAFSKITLPFYLLSKKQRIQKKSFAAKLNAVFYDLYKKNQYSYAFSRYLQPIFLLDFQKDMKIICDVDDVYFEKQQSKIKNETNFRQRLKLRIFYLFESKKIKQLLSRIDIPIVVKEADRSFYGLKNAACLPNLPFSFFINGQELPKVVTNDKVSEKISFGFIGKLSYPPNCQGLISFLNLVWKPLMENGFDSRFTIAGSGKIPEVLKKAIDSSKNIDLLGFVETSDIFWDAISVLVVPVAEGGGSNIKIAEAFINGKTVIANEFAARGYEDFVDDSCFHTAKTTKDWIRIMTNQTIPSIEQIETTKSKARNLYDLEKWNQKLLNILP